MNATKKLLVGSAITAAAVVGGMGGSVLNSLSASAATSTAGAIQSDTPDHDSTKGGHHANGITEALLTGDAAAKAKAAVLAANAGATIERVENDAEGAAYEAHIVKTDGTEATVKMDANFKVTSTEAHPAR